MICNSVGYFYIKLVINSTHSVLGTGSDVNETGGASEQTQDSVLAAITVGID